MAFLKKRGISRGDRRHFYHAGRKTVKDPFLCEVDHLVQSADPVAAVFGPDQFSFAPFSLHKERSVMVQDVYKQRIIGKGGSKQTGMGGSLFVLRYSGLGAVRKTKNDAGSLIGHFCHDAGGGIA